jgi:hypothetical protein
LEPPNLLLAQKTEKVAAQNEAQQPKDFSIELLGFKTPNQLFSGINPPVALTS